MKVFVSNLPHSAGDEQIKELFAQKGTVKAVELMTDNRGRSRCFGFVYIDDVGDDTSSLRDLTLDGRVLRVEKAHAAEREGGRGGFGGRGGGGRRGGYGGRGR